MPSISNILRAHLPKSPINPSFLSAAFTGIYLVGKMAQLSSRDVAALTDQYILVRYLGLSVIENSLQVYDASISRKASQMLLASAKVISAIVGTTLFHDVLDENTKYLIAEASTANTVNRVVLSILGLMPIQNEIMDNLKKWVYLHPILLFAIRLFKPPESTEESIKLKRIFDLDKTLQKNNLLPLPLLPNEIESFVANHLTEIEQMQVGIEIPNSYSSMGSGASKRSYAHPDLSDYILKFPIYNDNVWVLRGTFPQDALIKHYINVLNLERVLSELELSLLKLPNLFLVPLRDNGVVLFEEKFDFLSVGQNQKMLKSEPKFYEEFKTLYSKTGLCDIYPFASHNAALLNKEVEEMRLALFDVDCRVDYSMPEDFISRYVAGVTDLFESIRIQIENSTEVKVFRLIEEKVISGENILPLLTLICLSSLGLFLATTQVVSKNSLLKKGYFFTGLTASLALSYYFSQEMKFTDDLELISLATLVSGSVFSLLSISSLAFMSCVQKFSKEV
jgi:hypothetical protein